MLALLDTPRMAHRYGKNRGYITALACLMPLALAFFFSNIVDLMGMFTKSSPSNVEIFYWCELGCWIAAIALFATGAWQLYRDETHGDYIDLAEHHRRQQ
ncbi:MAG: hypothetical protein EON56_05825 [Alphaproteobacteria bacterium]|nr:MAG: hypothetical protein EON56_05825 [Alphaproteobacteria bacterium]